MNKIIYNFLLILVVSLITALIRFLPFILFKLKIKGVNFYIDAPVSNSGKLKTAIYETSEKWDVDVNVEIIPNPDVILEKSNYVVSSDSIILDKCDGWINLVGYIIEKYMKEVWVIELT